MPRGLIRFHHSGSFHFITFSCYHRLPLLARSGGYCVFEAELEATRVQYQFVVAAYVIMPEHVHLLVKEPRLGTLATVLQVLKQKTSRKLKTAGEPQFWQRRYYDFVVPNEAKRIEKLRYIHRNPVKRLVPHFPGSMYSTQSERNALNFRGGMQGRSPYPRGNQRPDGLRGSSMALILRRIPMKKLLWAACFVCLFANVSRMNAQDTTGTVGLSSRLKASVTLTLPDGRSCTTAPYRKGDAEICLIKDVAYGKYRVSITRAGQTVEVNLVVRTRGLFEVEGNCEVKEDGSGACDTD